MAPPARGGLARLSAHNASRLVNWTMTYHESSDIVAYYGYFRSLNASVQYAWDKSCHWRDSPGKGCKLYINWHFQHSCFIITFYTS